MSRLILTLLVAILCTSLSCVYFLRKGVRLGELTIGPIAISELTLVWQDKLELEIARLSLLESKSETKPNGFSTPVAKAYSAARAVATFFSKLIIDEIQAGDITGTLSLVKDPAEKSYLHLQSNDLSLRSDIVFNKDGIVVDITEASSRQFSTKASGKLFFDAHSTTITGDISVNISESFPVTIHFTADRHHISFEGKEAGKISTISPLVDLFGLDHNIQRWITDYLHGSRYNLKVFSGSGTWKEPITFLHNLHAEVRVDNCEYTFAPGLEPIKTKYTDVTFDKGVLVIVPHDSSFYGQSCEDSWLDINFNTPSDIILTARITTHAAANKDILTLLEYYKLSLPFTQIKGKTAVDLTLAIHLNDLQISADGAFHIDKGVLLYNQENLKVSNVHVTLKNGDINIESGEVRLKKLLTASVTGVIHASQGVGLLELEIVEANLPFGKSILTIDPSQPRPRLEYHIQKDTQWVKAKASSWRINTTKIQLGPFSAPFSYDLEVTLPPVLVTLPPGISARISGSLSINKKTIDLQGDLLQYHLKDLIMVTPSTPVSISYDKTLIIHHPKTSKWRLNNVPITLYPIEFSYSNNIISIVDGRLSYGSFFDSHVSGTFDYKLKHGSFYLEHLNINKERINEQLALDRGLQVEVNTQNKGIIIDLPDLDLRISTNDEGDWSATFTDLATLAERSPLLKQYHIDGGKLSISSKDGKKPYTFSANIPYHYPVLVKDNEPVDLFRINGVVSDQGFTASINEDIQITYTDTLSVTSKNIDFNLPAIIDLTNSPTSIEQPPGSKDKPSIAFSMDAVNTGLFLNKTSKLLADSIHLNRVEGKTSIKLLHGPGTIDLEVEGTSFSCKGTDLNDKFMSGLAQNGDLQNGSMSIVASGSVDEFSALLTIKNTILKNFRTLNNMMALIDTIPALITFSLPNYNSDGLPVTSAIVGMKVKENVATIESLDVDSPALSIAGKGSIDFSQKTIDMVMNLITSAKENINKIPLVGFVLVGDEKKPSITMKISGDLMDPEVTNSMYRNIAKTPFSMLYRTLKLPSRLIQSIDNEGQRVEGDKQKVKE